MTKFNWKSKIYNPATKIHKIFILFAVFRIAQADELHTQIAQADKAMIYKRIAY